jgi:DNA helicase-2/ATP-dependent DNA helicase PcrA
VGDLKNVRAGTFHSFGYKAWSQVIGTYLKPDAKKVNKIAEALQTPEWVTEFAVRMVSLGKQSAFGVTRPLAQEDWWTVMNHFDTLDLLEENVSDLQIEQALDWTVKIFEASNAACRTAIDFDDQLYAPLKFNARMWQNDFVLIDEAQDTNATRRMLARKMLKPGGRVVAVGDEHQAIFGFTGADNSSLALIQKDFNCVEMPLTVTYRCPKAVVDHARAYVSHITAHDSAPDGVVSSLTDAQFKALPAEALAAGDAVLCRNTKPLVDLAFALIRRGIGCHVEGREIGRGLLALALRWKKVKTIGGLLDKLAEYQEREIQKHMAKGNDLKAATVEDQCETLRAICASLAPDAPVTAIKTTVDKLFGDTTEDAPITTVILSTVHKSKGREWDRVYLYGRNQLMPSRYVRQQWEAEQENNLIYVAITRAKRELIEVEMEAKKRA